jgi:hypothetical protein
VRSTTSEWARQRVRVATPRNVGGTHKNKWTGDEDNHLAKAVQDCGCYNWSKVAAAIPGRTGKQCRERWLARLAPDILHEDWSTEEDLMLVTKQELLGNHWSKIKQYLPGRPLVSVKNRWKWLCRRDIPNHSHEFQTMVLSCGAGVARLQQPVVEPVQPPPIERKELKEGEIIPGVNVEVWTHPEVVVWDITG